MTIEILTVTKKAGILMKIFEEKVLFKEPVMAVA
jgi:hypothetical protein